MDPALVDPGPMDTIAKYFFFTALDDRISFTASLKVLSELKSKNWLDQSHRARWIQVLTKWKLRVREFKAKDWANTSASAKGFNYPGGLDLSLWISFQSAGKPDEVEAVLLSKILKFSDQEIAEGLNVTTGTVRYRVGRGVRHLGAYVEF